MITGLASLPDLFHDHGNYWGSQHPFFSAIKKVGLSQGSGDESEGADRSLGEH